ncbi:hypothetical protein [Granulicella mallensis]|uniref:Enterotoxin n=1 Tax=Granulicella mallensis (strain ATCC BAA-1857 / DSM 23137 / MP5ACTX8) TaxID=682795 RepID=G8NUD4_GRAMM|nr:hypothetical protein [Granulicella mallensis]AEU35290.1 hypothetical protein AciX8_0941 [Granulicella mallensis MP5ACTX8]
MIRFDYSCAVVLLALATAPAMFPQTYDAEAGMLRTRVAVHNRRFDGVSVTDTISGRSFSMKEAFVLVMKDRTELRSTEMQVSPIPEAASVSDPHLALRRSSDKVARTEECWQFTSAASSGSFAWCLNVRPGSNYFRELLRISAGNTDLPIAEVRLLQFADAGAKVDGSVKGSPVVDGNLFFGFEHPLSVSVVNGGVVRTSLFRDLPLRAGQAITYSAVVGTSQPGQMRRAFLAYLENERPRAYEPFLHYNSWFDLGYENRFDEAGAMNRVNEFGRHLVVERHVKLDSFLFDDGWDDPKTLWGFNSGFPNGFKKTGETAAKYNAGIGVWLSPWGGYAEQKRERIAYGRSHGFEIQNDGYALSGPKYFDRFEQICLEMVNKYHVNQFKFDGTGNANGVFPGSAFDSDFDAAIHLIERLRKEEPELFVNLTTGTTASPFWLFYADSIWRGGEDHDFSGVGDSRQRWITYRDAQTYKNIVVKGPLFPLNSLMLHGIIYAKQAKDLKTDPGNDFADEVHSYFGSGTQLQEMYITPALLTEANWNTLAEGARWSRAHSQILKDTHWIGGDPDKLEVYGWAAWTPEVGIVTLRNPSTKTQHYSLNLADTFELPNKSKTAYKLHNAWSSGRNSHFGEQRTVQNGKLLDVELAPFEVLTLQADPLR